MFTNTLPSIFGDVQGLRAGMKNQNNCFYLLNVLNAWHNQDLIQKQIVVFVTRGPSKRASLKGI